MHALLLLSLSLLSSASPLPSPYTPTPLEKPIISPFPIHHSCNATQQRMLATALKETITLAEHAKSHVLRWGNESVIYRKYFGNQPSITAIGAYDIIVHGNKEKTLFRCDDPDGNCALEGWGGHWRGENGTDETVICDLSYETRRSLTTMCALGYTVAESETNTFWAADLLHRLYHTTSIGQGFVEHFADGYEEVLELAQGNRSVSTRDSEALQYFALEAYAYDVVAPGVGCSGDEGEADHGHDHDEEEEEQAEDDEDIPENCHTHDGGELHCT